MELDFVFEERIHAIRIGAVMCLPAGVVRCLGAGFPALRHKGRGCGASQCRDDQRGSGESAGYCQACTYTAIGAVSGGWCR